MQVRVSLCQACIPKFVELLDLVSGLVLLFYTVFLLGGFCAMAISICSAISTLQYEYLYDFFLAISKMSVLLLLILYVVFVQ